MKKSWFFCAVVCVAILPVSGRAQDTGESRNSQQDPHRALSDAVEDIRAQYTTQSGANQNFVFHTRLKRPGLGIILGAGFFDADGEGELGATIVAVTPGSPADEAGLRSGDVVVAWNGEPLVDAGKDPRWTAAQASRELVERSRRLDEGDAVTLRYLRDGEELDVTVVAREIEFGPKVDPRWVGKPGFEYRVAPGAEWRSAQPWFLPLGWLDMEMVALNPDLGKYFGSETGVLVVRGPEGDETLGLASGDVILSIGGREVENPEHVMRILRSYEPDEELTIEIIRHSRSQTLTGTVPETSFRFDYRFKTSGEDD